MSVDVAVASPVYLAGETEMPKISSSEEAFQSQVPHYKDVVVTETEVRHFLSKLFSGWDIASDVKRVPGGITNTIYSATHRSGNPSQVLIRIFGGKDVFTPEDRGKENKIFEQLGHAGIAPKLLAVFDGGRVEAWLNARPIALNEMTSDYVCEGVAKAMAKLHAFKPLGVPHQGQLWQVLDGWAAEVVNLARDGRFTSINVDKCVASLGIVKKRLLGEDSPVVFCHNDLLFGNILVSNSDRAVSIVDFEYSSYNYRGFDIGNFFCEAMGGTVDGHVDATRYPSEAFRKQFCKVYLREAGLEATEDRIAGLVREAEDFGLASHLYWGFWALAQSAGSTVDFPYVLFAEQRFAEFFKRFTQK